MLWGLLSSFREKLNFENWTIIKEVIGICVKKDRDCSQGAFAGLKLAIFG